jgi:ribosome maturation factor RimP
VLTDRTTQDEELAVATGLPSQTQVIELLDGEFARAGYEIEDVVIDERSQPPRITVIAAGDTALDLDTVAALSRSASNLLDAKRDIGGTYVLEVSSPGIDRPLTSEKHFRRARGRKVDLTLTDGTQVSGRVGEIRDGTVDVVVRDGRDWTVRPIPLSDAAKAVVQVEFSQPPLRELELAGVDRADRSAETEGTT